MWNEAEKFLSNDKHIGPLIKKWGHCTIAPRKHKDYFVGIIGEIIGQQLSGRVADVIFDRFKKRVKGKITPGKVLALADQELRDCGMAWAKVRSLKDLAEKVKQGELKTKELAGLSDEEVERELVAVKGIGKWTAEMFLMFSLGRPDIFPSDDLGIRNGMKEIFAKEMTALEMERKALKWKPYRTVASWYIWRNLENR